MTARLLLPLAICAAAAAACGAGHATVRDAAGAPAPTTSGSTTPSTTQVCTKADMDAPPIAAMPSPERLSTPLTLDSGNETLSPPDRDPAVTAAQAWAKVTHSGFGPRSSGTARLVLAYLAAKTPATIQNYAWPPSSDHPDTQAVPIYTHTLVWAVIATDQAEVGSGGSSGGAPAVGRAVTTATTTPQQLCALETAVSYVDATTGVLLQVENF